MIKLKDIVVEVLNEGVKLSDVKKKWIEDKPGLTDVQINYYWDKINAYNQNSKEKINLLKTPFANVEKIVDAGSSKFSSSVKNIDGDYRDYAKNNGLVVYDKNNMMIVRADSKESCIILGKGEKWCIGRGDASNMYYTYKYALDNPTIYFSYDFDKVEGNVNGILVIMVNKDGKYNVADRNNAENSGNKKVTWDYISKLQPKLKGINSVFVYKDIPKDEKDRYNIVKKIAISNHKERLKSYKELDFDGKSLYIDVNQFLSSDLFWITSKELQEKYIKMGGSITYRDMIKLPPNLRKLFNTNLQERIKNKFSLSSAELYYLADTNQHEFIVNYINNIIKTIGVLSENEFNILEKIGQDELIIDYIEKSIIGDRHLHEFEIEYLSNNSNATNHIIKNYINKILEKNEYLYPSEIIYFIKNNKSKYIEYYIEELINNKSYLNIQELKFLIDNNKKEILKKYVDYLVEEHRQIETNEFILLLENKQDKLIMYYINKKIDLLVTLDLNVIKYLINTNNQNLLLKYINKRIDKKEHLDFFEFTALVYKNQINIINYYLEELKKINEPLFTYERNYLDKKNIK